MFAFVLGGNEPMTVELGAFYRGKRESAFVNGFKKRKAGTRFEIEQAREVK